MKKKYLFEYDMTFITILSVILFIIPSLIVYGYYLLTRNMPFNTIDLFFLKAFRNEIGISKMIFIFAVFFVLTFIWMVLHELIHGFFYVYKGANKKNITYGAALEKGVFFCRCGEYVYKDTVMTSLMAPFILIGVITLILGMIFHSYLLLILSIFNISGAAGDITMYMFFLEQEDKNLKFIEFGDTLTFAIDTFDNLNKKSFKGIKLIKEISNNNELPKSNNSHKIDISVGSYVILFLLIILMIILWRLAYNI